MSPKKHSQRYDPAAAKQSPPRREAANVEALDTLKKTYVTPKVFAIGRFDAVVAELEEEPEEEPDYDDELMTALVFNVDTIAPQGGDNYTSAELTAIKVALGK